MCTAPQRVDYLRRRQRALAGNPLFAGTELIDDPDEFARRLPFMAAKRDFSEPVALNWAPDGTDVDFGALSSQLIGYGGAQRHNRAVRSRGPQPVPAGRRRLDADRSAIAVPAKSAS